MKLLLADLSLSLLNQVLMILSLLPTRWMHMALYRWVLLWGKALEGEALLAPTPFNGVGRCERS